jgi:hypothetical protein
VVNRRWRKRTLASATIHRIHADGVNVFYREAGPVDAPVVLLLPRSARRVRRLVGFASQIAGVYQAIPRIVSRVAAGIYGPQINRAPRVSLAHRYRGRLRFFRHTPTR